MPIPIQDNIPIPTDYCGRRPKGELRVAMESLQLGQSFAIDRKRVQPLYLYKLARKVGIRISSRPENCESRRIWRVK